MFAEMVTTAIGNLAAAGVGEPEVFVADAGYWSPANAELESAGEVLIAPMPASSGISDPDDPRIEQRHHIIAQLDRGAITTAEAARQMGVSTTWTRRLLANHRNGIDAARSRAKMQRRLATDEGAAAFAKRKTTVEPVFGQIKHNLRYRRFTVRGLTAAISEWRLICSIHNLLKLHRHRLATT